MLERSPPSSSPPPLPVYNRPALVRCCRAPSSTRAQLIGCSDPITIRSGWPESIKKQDDEEREVNMLITKETGEVFNCAIKLRGNPQRQKDKVYIGCGAGFAGDRPQAALKLLQRVKELDYLVLECLAERTLADRYQHMMSGGKGYDPRISDWMSLLLPLALERGVCIITNMGAVDPLGALQEVMDVARNLGLGIRGSVAYEDKSGHVSAGDSSTIAEGSSTYLGAAPIVHCLERYKPHVVITSRVADAALFLAPMVYELGWDWDDFERLSQGALAGHLMECGCQLTGGYFMHPGDKCRDLSFEQLLDLSLPFAEVSYGGEIRLAKAEGSGGVLNYNTCAEQLLYEIGDPSFYATPDVVIDICEVYFCELSTDRVLCAGAKPSNVRIPEKLLQLVPMECGWKGWGEISYGGHGCIRRAEAAEFLVRSWMDEAYPGTSDCVVSYIIGHDSIKASGTGPSSIENISDIRLRLDGLFELKEHALHFVEEFTALYTNGPAGGGGICTGHKKEITLRRELTDRENVFWQTEMRELKIDHPSGHIASHNTSDKSHILREKGELFLVRKDNSVGYKMTSRPATFTAPSGKLHLYEVAHCRAGDKGNDLNLSIIPHFPLDIERLKMVITPNWVRDVVSVALTTSSFDSPHGNQQKDDTPDHMTVEIYEVRGIHSLNIVVRNILDGGVNCSRRIDRHGKTMSDLILCQKIILPL